MTARRRRARVSAPTLAAVVAAMVTSLVVLGPALRPGFTLVGDMVFVPRLPLTRALAGLSAQAPRAVPSDAVVALLSTFLPGQVVQKLILVAVLLAAGAGTARLVPLGRWGAAAAAVAAVWNPYVGERLAAGQWAVLVGYAALPWVVRGAWLWGSERGAASWWDRRSWVVLALPVVLGSLGGAPAWLLVALVAGVSFLVAACGRAAGQPRRPVALGIRAGLLTALLGAMALPWAVPALLRPGGTVGDPAGAVFAPRPDTPLGVVGSLLTGGGIWNSDVVPAGRDTVVGAVCAVLLLALAVVGLASARRRGGPPRPGDPAPRAGVVCAVVASGVVGLFLALLVVPHSTGQTLAGLPAAGLLRDGARQAGPWVVATSLGVGMAVDAVATHRERWRAVGGAGLAAVLGLLPVAALPSLAWGQWGRLAAVSYPHDYADVAALLRAWPDARPGSERRAPGAVVVLPFEAYRRYHWNRDRPALDPLARWLPAVTVAGSDLVVRRGDGSAVRVAGEDRYAGEVGQVLRSADPAPGLAALGVRWVVVDVVDVGDVGEGGAVAPPNGLLDRWTGAHLRLLEVPGVNETAARSPGGRWQPPATPVLLADGLSVLVAALVGVLGVVPVRRSAPARLNVTRVRRPGDTVR